MINDLLDVCEQRTRNWWPSYCQVCDLSADFPSQRERREWEATHQHGGVD